MNTSSSIERVTGDDSSGRCSSSSTGSFTSYATLPNVDYNSEVLSTCDGQKLVQDSLSLENNAASTGTLAYSEVGVGKGGRRARGRGRRARGRGNITMCSLYSSDSENDGDEDDGDDDEEGDCDRDSSIGDNKSSCSDYSMEDCDVTIGDDTSLKRSSTKNEAEMMFLQVVEILRFEKKVNQQTYGAFHRVEWATASQCSERPHFQVFRAPPFLLLFVIKFR